MENKKELNLLAKIGVVVLALVAIYLLTLISNSFREGKYIGVDVASSKTIVVSGSGEWVAVPDEASFSVSVQGEGTSVSIAREKADKDLANILNLLREKGIEGENITTTNYSISPRYERKPCSLGLSCPYQQELKGYTAYQSLRVKIEDINILGEVFGIVGDASHTVNGLSLDVSNREELSKLAREEAINEAREEAKTLAKQLGVSLGGIVSFSESGGNQSFDTRAYALEASGGSVPQIPTGESAISANVTVIYEIW
jgi:uncharacterized protein